MIRIQRTKSLATQSTETKDGCKTLLRTKSTRTRALHPTSEDFVESPIEGATLLTTGYVVIAKDDKAPILQK